MSIITLILAVLLMYSGALLSAYFKWSFEVLMKPISWIMMDPPSENPEPIAPPTKSKEPTKTHE